MKLDKNKIRELWLRQFYEEQEKLTKEILKDLNYKIYGFKSRILKTEYGDFKVKIRRFKYIDPKTNLTTYKYHDSFNLLFLKNKRIQLDLMNKILDLSLTGISANSIKNNLQYDNISKKTILQIIKENKKIDNDDIHKKDKKISCKSIYIEIDDSYQHGKFNKKKVKIRHRMIFVHTGKNSIKNIMNKNIILETRIVGEEKLSLEELVWQTHKFIKSNFINYSNILVIGDGARWIKRFANMINGEYILDTFHLKRLVNKFCYFGKYNTQNKKNFEKFGNISSIINNFLTNGSPNKAIEEIVKIIPKISQTKKKEALELIRYIKNNILGIKNYKLKNNIGSRTELLVSHYIKKITTRKFTLFSVKTILNNLYNNLLVKQVRYFPI